MMRSLRSRRTTSNAFGKSALKSLAGTSSAAIVAALAMLPTPAEAQLARLRGAAATPAVTGAGAAAGTIVTPSMRAALVQQQSTQVREAAMRTYITSVRQAAATSLTRATPTNGISPAGLYPIAQVREAMALARGDANAKAASAALLASLQAGNDRDGGKSTWEGAGLPTESADKTLVTIDQTQSRAVLTWNNFDVGAQTTLQFNQKQGGIAQPGWIALNRVVDSANPTTILGKIKADGAVYILNSRGVIFGKGSQVNLTSLLASSLDVGSFASNFRAANSQTNAPALFSASSIADRNTQFLLNGPSAAGSISFAGGQTTPPIFLSASLAAGDYAQQGSNPQFLSTGAVEVDPGASVTTTEGGYLVLAAPSITNGGTLSAVNGQVSLQAGQLITHVQSSGAATSVDPNVRGFVLRTVTSPYAFENSPPDSLRPADGSIFNTGIIESKRGYLSLGTGAYGEITNNGLLTATTSVSRNGFIRLNAGTIVIGGSSDAAQAGGLSILAEETGETIPQGDANTPPAFKTSQIEIGARGGYGENLFANPFATLLPATVTFGQNSLLYAPGAKITIGAAVGDGITFEGRQNTAVRIASGALIDVGGLKDVAADGSKNIIAIKPVKRNELRDTPTYREVAIGDEFTLNGSTLYVDVRNTGVRSDGVRWVGSPLIEAGSAATQISTTVSELLTRGGTVSLVDRGDPLSIAAGATIDISGGWIHYSKAQARASQLVTTDGRIVDISQADLNDRFVAIAAGFTAQQPRFGVSQTYANPVNTVSRQYGEYISGRDAGALTIAAPTLLFDGSLSGAAYAGSLQLSAAIAPTATSTILGDTRTLQMTATELPSGGFVSITPNRGDLPVGGDIVIYRGTRLGGAATIGETLLSDTMLSNAGLSALSLSTSGSILVAGADPLTLQNDDAYDFTGAATLALAPGGHLTLRAGRSITFDGNVTIAGGKVSATTALLNTPGLGATIGGQDLVGSAYRIDDDLLPSYTAPSAYTNPFDIVVNGTISTAGLWTNDALDPSVFLGRSFTKGGSIELSVAPRVFVGVTTAGRTTEAIDLSGAISINAGAMLDVSAGGYVTPQRTLVLSGRGGAISLINETLYAATAGTNNLSLDGSSDRPINGESQSVDFTPVDATETTRAIVPQLIPTIQRARVGVADGTLKAFGFAEGGDFTLVAPGITFGSAAQNALSTHIGLDFLEKTGFGSLKLTANHSRTIAGLFSNGRTGNSAFLDTTTFRIGSGENLDLTQTLLPPIPIAEDQLRLIGLPTGTLVRNALTPTKPADAFEQKAVSLSLGGLSELVIERGGSLTGAAGASIVAPKIVSDGTIRIAGGTVRVDNVPFLQGGSRYAYVSTLEAFFGPAIGGKFDENAINPLFGVTNREVLTANQADRQLVLAGVGSGAAGISLGANSITDLSGVALYDPRATVIGQNVILRSGRVVAGGFIGTPSPAFGPSSDRRFDAAAGAVIKLDGASGLYDQVDNRSRISQVLQWSDGGTLARLGSGSFTGASVSAKGGTAQAFGGTLEVLNAVLRPTSGMGNPDNSVFADEIQSAGFDTFIADGSLTFDGNATLTLGRAFILAPFTSTDTSAPQGFISATGNTDAVTGATINAPYIRFEGGQTTAIAPNEAIGTARIMFNAGASGFDAVGGIKFGAAVSSVGFESTGDFRLTGIPYLQDSKYLVRNGELLATGALTFDVGRVYATTGTGNLQQILDAPYTQLKANFQPFTIATTSQNGITFLGNHLNAAIPMSVGSYLSVVAPKIVQNGHLAAPIGRLDLGDASTQTVSFGAGSITSVYGGTDPLPYGTTVDLNGYFYNPLGLTKLNTLPTGRLQIKGASIDVGAGATVDLRGGSDVFAYEFLSGVGGSRDVLSRFNTDLFSSNNYNSVTGTGYQYADERQVFAIVPKSSMAVAMYDPVYSADYGRSGPVDLYGSSAGISITIDGNPLLTGGEYVLMPAHYALLPGAIRVVENVGQAAPSFDGVQTLLDGSIIVGGVFSTVGSDKAQSQRRSFSLQSQSTFLKYADIRTTPGSAFIVKQSTASDRFVPRLPTDAASAILAPLNSLAVKGLFNTTHDVDELGARFDIAGLSLVIAPEGATIEKGDVPRGEFTLLDPATLNALNAESLLIGGTRTDRLDGGTDLAVTAGNVRLLSGTVLSAPEILLAVKTDRLRGGRAGMVIGDNVQLTATGLPGVSTSADYVVSGSSGLFGSVVRVANGPDRLVRREQADSTEIDVGGKIPLQIGAATFTGDSVTLESTDTVQVGDGAKFAIKSLVLSGPTLNLGNSSGNAGFLNALSGLSSVTLSSTKVIGFEPGSYSFGGLKIDGPGIAPTNLGGFVQNGNSDVSITADSVLFSNSYAATQSCGASGNLACGLTDDLLSIGAKDIVFGSGSVQVYGFGGGTTISASNGIFVQGAGSFNAGGGKLSLLTPQIADRGTAADPRSGKTRPDYLFATNGLAAVAGASAAKVGDIVIDGADFANPADDTSLAIPGSKIAFGSIAAPVASITVNDARLRATAGLLELNTVGDIAVTGASTLAVPGYSRRFGDATDNVTVAANAGLLALYSTRGDISVGAATRLVTDTGVGAAGTLSLISVSGAIDGFGALALNPGVAGPRSGSLTFAAATSAFDFEGFLTRNGAGFGGDIEIYAGRGDLVMAAGQTLSAKSVSLTADDGQISIGGTIDTSGESIAGLTIAQAAKARVNAGNIALFGQDRVTLTATARLDTHTNGYADTDTRVASGGNVSLGIGNSAAAALVIDEAAVIDVGARRTQAANGVGGSGNRLVGQVVTDPNTFAPVTAYRFVEADQGGIVALRAPLIGTGFDRVNVAVDAPASIVGARDIQLEAYRQFDLGAIVAGGEFSGITTGIVAVPDSNGISKSSNYYLLDLAKNSTAAEVAAGAKPNFLAYDSVSASGVPSLVHFVRNFSATAGESDLTDVRLRPGIDLVARDRGILLQTNWNLAAAAIDTAAAAARGDLVVNAGLTTSAANPVYAVAAGREASLLENANFFYRVGGSIRGEAPVLSLHAAGNVRIERSISDGYFVFRDRADPDYVSTTLGGGLKIAAVGLKFGCGRTTDGDCKPLTNGTGIASYADGIAGDLPIDNAVNISIAAATPGTTVSTRATPAPYSNAANGAAALGTMPVGPGSNAIGGLAGASLGFADVLPVLSDGSQAHSSSINLVAGAAAITGADGKEAQSANPLHVDHGLNSDVVVTDVAHSIGQDLPTSYLLKVGEKSAVYSPSAPLQLVFKQPKGDDEIALDVDNFFGALQSNDAANEAGVSALTADSFTNFSFGGDPAIREAAMKYFPADSVFKGSKKSPSGVYAPLSKVVGFLQSFESTYVGGVADGSFKGAKVPNNKPIVNYGKTETSVQTFVRTGDGSIALAASGTVDLRGEALPLYQTNKGQVSSSLGANGKITKPGANESLYGGTSVYTVGHRIAPGTVDARVVGGASVAIDLPSVLVGQAASVLEYTPSPHGGSAEQPLALTGGGAVKIDAATVLGRRDVAAELYAATPSDANFPPTETFGDIDQIWRPGSIGQNTSILLAPQYFSTGVGALGGGDVTIRSRGTVDDLTVALDSSMLTTQAAGTNTLLTFGAGNLSVATRGDIVSSRFSIAHGRGDISTRGSTVTGAPDPVSGSVVPEFTRVRVTDANVFVTAGKTAVVQIGGIEFGNLSAASGIDVRANGAVALTAVPSGTATVPRLSDPRLLPASVGLVSLDDSVAVLDEKNVLFPSPIGQLELFSSGDIKNLSIAMLDSDPSVIGGVFAAPQPLSDGNALTFAFPGIDDSIGEARRRLYHNRFATHLADTDPARIFTLGSLNLASINLPKQARIVAAKDIVNTYFVGQNLTSTDVTRIAAGRDILALPQIVLDLGNKSQPITSSLISSFMLGGPGSLSVEAGRNIGPFPVSAEVDGRVYTSGIMTVGNDYNPWLGAQGADINLAFGVGPGYDYARLRDVYLNPANGAQLDGDLFVQVDDELGNERPDRSKPIYAPILAAWLRDNAADTFSSLFAGQNFDSDAALANAAYGRYGDLYTAFLTLPQTQQNKFLVQGVFFNELKAPSLPEGSSYLQYIRGYRAVEALFPAGLGYTDNLSSYTLDPATIDADHPLGVPTRKTVNGIPQAAERVLTGSADFRLAALETTRGGAISVLAPGGDLILGSQIRTETLIKSLTTPFAMTSVIGSLVSNDLVQLGALTKESKAPLGVNTLAFTVPLASEGILTLRSGAIYSFTDGDLRLNQSRLFTNGGGNITAWSSNGDLAAGQGPKNASSFPPITVKFDLNGFPTLDTAGSISGAGIGAFKANPTDPASDIVLIAPVGLVDAGDAGVRSSGNVFVAAARVANADNFSAGGSITGVPTGTPVAGPVAVDNTASSIAAQVAQGVKNSVDRDRSSQITVDILGYAGGDKCDDTKVDDPNCPK